MTQPMSKLTALVPMRHHSQRVPGKNYRPLAGRPLFHHILLTLQTVPGIDEIIVDTDSPVIKDGISKHFPSVTILDRPDHLCGDATSMNAIISHDVSQQEAEFFLQTHSTNPLLKTVTISRAIELFFNHYPGNDSLFSVTRIYTRLWDEDAQAINHNPSELIQTQNLPPIYEENSCLYIFSKEGFERQQHRIGERPFMFEMDRREAWDIDTELEFEIVEYLMEREQRE